MTNSHSRKIVLGLALALAALAPAASAQKKYGGTKGVTKHGNIAIAIGSKGVGFSGDLGFKSKHGFGGKFSWNKPFSKHRSSNKKHGKSVGYGSYGSYGGYGGYGGFPSCCPWVPGHYTTVKEKVWVAGHSRKVWIEPTFEVWSDCGVLRRRVLSGGHYEYVNDPGYWDTFYKKVWVPGGRKCSSGIHSY